MYCFVSDRCTKCVMVQAKGDVATNEKQGGYYPATFILSQKDMLIDGKRVNLSPGMNITAEIKTGQRRIIEFLLSPVQSAGSESLRGLWREGTTMSIQLKLPKYK